MKKSILAIEAAVPAMPVNPKTAATIAMMKKTRAQYNISAFSFCFSTQPEPIERNLLTDLKLVV